MKNKALKTEFLCSSFFSLDSYSTCVACRRTGVPVSLFVLPHPVHVLQAYMKDERFQRFHR